MFKEIIQNFIGVLLLRPRSLMTFLEFISFFRSSQVGAGKGRIYYRFRDLDLLRRLNLISGNVLELGSGSSTFFFRESKQVSNLLTVEEEKDYLFKSLKKVSERDRVQISPKLVFQYGNLFGSRYSKQFSIKEFDFVYIDGPSCNTTGDGFSSPCLDAVIAPASPGSTYAVDARSATVLLLWEHLKSTHFLLPSKVLIYDIERYKDFVLKKAGFISTLDLRDCRGEIPTLIRTSVFVPLEKLEDIICNDPKILLLCK